jgi:hypothetical protein
MSLHVSPHGAILRRYINNLILFNYAFYMDPNIIRKIKSRRMRWAGHVARRGRREMRIGYWWESQKERDHKEDQDVGGWIILK